MTTTVDDSEIKHFDNLAQEWWKEKGKYNILHDINPCRLKFICNSIREHFHISNNTKNPFEGLKILDVGCGGGLLSLPLARLGAEVLGVDASVSNIEAAESHSKKFDLPNLKYMTSCLEKLEQNTKHDVIIAFEVLEHISNLDLFIESCASRLADNGLILFSTINRNLKSRATAIFLAERILSWIPVGTHHYNKLLKPSEINHALQKHNLRILEMKGFEYDILRRKWFISDDISVNYMMKICGT